MSIDIDRPPLGVRAGAASSLRRWWDARHVYVIALLIFAASRCVVAGGAVFGRFIVPKIVPEPWIAGSAWYYRLVRWDSGWFASIVRDGYRFSADPKVHSSTAFYPAYPFLSRLVGYVFGIDAYLALLLVANVASVAVVLLMTKLFKDQLGNDTALVSMTCFCFFPFSLFLSAGYTESLFLVFLLASLIFVTREKFVSASLFAGLAVAVRPTGIVLLPVILWEMMRRNTTSLPRLLPTLALCGVLAISGLLAFAVYLWIIFGNPLAFVAGQSGWHPESWSTRLVAGLTLAPFRQWPWNNPELLAEIIFLIFFGLTLLSFRFVSSALSLYGLGSLFLPYFSLGLYTSTHRFALVCVPAFMTMGIIGKGRPWLINIVVGLFGALLLVASALFSQWYVVG
jgi:hypothetical protein